MAEQNNNKNCERDLPIDTDLLQAWPSGKVGYCALLGRPNAGKSTLVNNIIVYHLAAVSPRPQTTRRRWLGIYTDSDSQIVFLDTPGVHKPNHALGQYMDNAIRTSITAADVLLCLGDATRSPGEEARMVATRARQSGKPVVVALNKQDAAKPGQLSRAQEFWKRYFPDAPCCYIAAAQNAGLAELLAVLKTQLPHGPFLYEPDRISDAMERHIAIEAIREATFVHLSEEIPHATGVTIENWEEDEQGVGIGAVLHVERKQQKPIVIGERGRMLRQIRTYAENTLTELWGEPVLIEIWVKVSEKWRRKKGAVKDLA